MIRKREAGVAAGLLIFGTITGALSKWYLVWLAEHIGGAEQLGAYGFLFAVATPVFVAAQLGLRTIFLSKKTNFPWTTYVWLRVVGLVLGSLVVIVFSFLYPEVPLMLGCSILMLKIADSMVDLDLARIQYSGKIKTMALFSLLGGFLSLILSTIGFLLSGNLSISVGGAALGSLITALVARVVASRVDYLPDTEASGFKDILLSSLPVTVAQILASLLLYIPIIFLGSSADLVTVGIYTGVSYLITVADILGSSISKLLITPLRNRRRALGDLAVIGTVKKISLQVSIVAFIAMGPFLIFGSPVFQWVYGPQFDLPTVVLLLFTGSAFFVLLSHIQSVCLNVLNRYYSVASSFALACLLSMTTGWTLLLVQIDPLTVGAGMALSGAATRALLLVLSITRINAQIKLSSE